MNYRWFAICLLLALITMPGPVFAQVREAQAILNTLRLDAGPVDGVMGPKTVKAWQAFLRHRGLSESRPLDYAGLEELRGQRNISLPSTDGIRLSIASGRFPSTDTYQRDPDNPRAFSVRLRKGDYDPVDYRGSTSPFEQTAGINFNKQRAELESQRLRPDRTYTVDFEVNIDNDKAGSIFQIHGADGIAFLMAYSDAIRLSAGPYIQKAVYRGAWLGTWQKIRIVFHPASEGNSWFRVYVNEVQTLDTMDLEGRLPMGHAVLHFGMYRGGSEAETVARYRSLALVSGDIGAPPPDE